MMTQPRYGRPLVLGIALWSSLCAGACTDARSDLTLQGSTPCPPGEGTVETWCDDAGNCEFRVVGGPTFACTAGDSAGCTDAAQQAAEACSSGAGASDGGVTASICADLCAACSNMCVGCAEYEAAATEAGCHDELDSFASCYAGHACPTDAVCTSEAQAFSSCVCPSLLPSVRAAAEECGRTFDYTCADDIGGALAFSCAPKIADEGCAAFDSALCGNF